MTGGGRRSRTGWMLTGLLAVGLILLSDWWLDTEVPLPDLPGPAPSEPDEPASSLLPPSVFQPERQDVAEAPTLPVTVEGVVILGIVRDPDDEPVAGATLALKPASDRDAASLTEVTSDAKGRFRFELPRPDEDVLLVATADGFRQASWGPRRDWSADEITIRMRWVTALFGRVLDAETGDPLAEASVYGFGTTTSDAQGRYRQTEVTVGQEAVLVVRLAGYVPLHEPFMLRDRVPTELDLHLRRGHALTIEVVDRFSGLPLPGAEVRPWRTGEVLQTTDALGRFATTVEDGMQLMLHVSAEDHASLEWNATVNVLAMTPARLSLAPLAFIEGTVMNTEGAPVEGVWVSAGRDEAAPIPIDLPGDFEDQPLRETSDARGLYRAGVLPAEGPVTVTAYTKEYLELTRGPFVLDAPGMIQHLDLILERGGTIRGQATHNDEPWPWATIVWKRAPGINGGRTHTDETGAYELLNVPPGAVQLEAVGPLGEPLLDPVTLVVQAGRDSIHDLRWVEELTTISGRVTDTAGQPVADANVDAGFWDGEGGYRSHDATTDEQGLFRVDAVPGLLYSVSAGRAPRSDARKDVPAGSTGIEFVLPDVGLLRIQFVDAITREPPRGLGQGLWQLAWRTTGDEAYRWLREPVDTAGLIEIELQVGVVDVGFSYQAGGYAPGSVEALPVTQDPDPAPFVVELMPGLDVHLPISGTPDRTQLADHLVFLLADDQLAALRGPYPSQGAPSNHRINGVNMWVSSPLLMNQLVSFYQTDTAVVPGLAPGRYHIRCFPDDLVFEPATLVVGPGSTTHAVSWSLIP